MWSDKWYIEGNEAYYIGGECQILFKTNLDSMKTEVVTVLPVEKVFSFRGHHECIKKENKVYCLPDMENDIFVFDLIEAKWKTINVEIKKNDRLSIREFYEEKDRIFFTSVAAGRIIEVCANNDEICNEYVVPIEENENIREGYSEKNKYFFLTDNSKLYLFDCNNKKFSNVSIPVSPEEAVTFVKYGEYIWIGGKNEYLNRISLSDCNNLGVDNKIDVDRFYIFPAETIRRNDMDAFLAFIRVGNYIWCIPKYTNHIPYFNINAEEISYISVIEEEGKDFPRLPVSHYYSVLYVRNDRCIGLYSYILRSLIEIDVIELRYVIRKCVENDIDGGNLIIDLIKKENEIAFVETDEWFTLKNFISCI